MKIDFYTGIHKALRRQLFELSMHLGVLDINNIEHYAAFSQRLLQLVALLKEHAEHEAEHFHPLIAQKIPLEYRQLTTEHSQQDESLNELIADSNAILTLSVGEIRKQAGLALYKKLNLFIADYLAHLGVEETLMPILQACCSDDELLAALQSLLASFSETKIQASIVYMLPALNPVERLQMIAGLLMNAPSDIIAARRKIIMPLLTATERQWLSEQGNVFT